MATKAEQNAQRAAALATRVSILSKLLAKHTKLLKELIDNPLLSFEEKADLCKKIADLEEQTGHYDDTFKSLIKTDEALWKAVNGVRQDVSDVKTEFAGVKQQLEGVRETTSRHDGQIKHLLSVLGQAPNWMMITAVSTGVFFASWLFWSWAYFGANWHLWLSGEHAGARWYERNDPSQLNENIMLLSFIAAGIAFALSFYFFSHDEKKSEVKPKVESTKVDQPISSEPQDNRKASDTEVMPVQGDDPKKSVYPTESARS